MPYCLVGLYVPYQTFACVSKYFERNSDVNLQNSNLREFCWYSPSFVYKGLKLVFFGLLSSLILNFERW